MLTVIAVALCSNSKQVIDYRFDTHDTMNSYHLGHTPNQRIDEAFVVKLLDPMHIPESQWI